MQDTAVKVAMPWMYVVVRVLTHDLWLQAEEVVQVQLSVLPLITRRPMTTRLLEEQVEVHQVMRALSVCVPSCQRHLQLLVEVLSLQVVRLARK